MMDWNKLLSSRRYQPGSTITMFRSHDRSQFQRDYDRLIFSSPFRRLQNKTQVFPLPGNIFVHNRLTHSLEVASVGRSLGNKIAQVDKTKEALEHPEILEEIGTIVSTACLAHDLGNPPFGHSGEEAISYLNVTSKRFYEYRKAKLVPDPVKIKGFPNPLYTKVMLDEAIKTISGMSEREIYMRILNAKSRESRAKERRGV